MDRDLDLALVRLYILAHAASAPVYGVRLLEELTRHGYHLGFGTLYPMLHRLEADGLLSREDRLENGRVRKYYVATAVGRERLAWARLRLADVYQELAGEPKAEPRPIAGNDGGAPLIDLESFRAWRASTGRPRPTLLDVRSASEYGAGHVPGARHLPYEELSDRLGELERQRPIVTYCTMRHRGSARSERAAVLLRGHGFEAWALDGGLPAWVGANLPLERTNTGT